MSESIGIIGKGCVGSAVGLGLSDIGHNIIYHDLQIDSKLSDLKNTYTIFICVATPLDERYNCDTSAVETIVAQLEEIQYTGIIAIKSTVTPGFTDSLTQKYQNLSICFVPEFLREKSAYNDFRKDHKLLVVGSENYMVFNHIVDLHKNIPQKAVCLKPTQAEILKYMSNSIASTKVVFANIFYQICNQFDCDYSEVKNACVETGKIDNSYLDVNENLRGYSGACLPKDIRAIQSVLEEHNLDYELLRSVINDNEKIQKNS